MTQFEPEIGQAVFGAAYSQYEVPDFMIAGLKYLACEIERVEWNKTQEKYDAPIHNNGGYFKTDVFEIRAYQWGECNCGFEEKANKWYDKNNHRKSCYQIAYNKLNKKYKSMLDVPKKEVKALCKKYNIPYNDGVGSAVHCTCDYEGKWAKFLENNEHKKDCPVVVPNFKYKDFEIRWYKYLGRSTSMNKLIDANEFSKILDRCLESVRKLDNVEDY